MDFCSDCLVTQVMSNNRHSLDHKLIGLRVTTEAQSHSDEEDENDGEEEGIVIKKEDVSNSDDQVGSSIHDEDYMQEKFTDSNSSYNYFEPNFLNE